MRTDLQRVVLNGPTMGTRFAAVFYVPPGFDRNAAGRALAGAVGQVDREMSTWKPESDLMQFNRAPVGVWVELPAQLLTVMEAGLEIGRASEGAFDIGLLDQMRAFGFHETASDAELVERLTGRQRMPAHEIVVVDRAGGRAMKWQHCAIDLSGIAKGFGVDQLADVLVGMGIGHFLVSIDGELRAAGGKPDGTPWRVAVEQPHPEARNIAGVVEVVDGAIATSGNYRHRRELGGCSYSHTIDGRTGQPVADDTLSATVRAPTCIEADAWATVTMVLGQEKAAPLLTARGFRAMTISAEPSLA